MTKAPAKTRSKQTFMSRMIDRAKLVFLAIFVLSVAAVVAHQMLVVRPQERCEARGAWWDPEGRVCATPVYIPNLTGRPAQAPPAP